MTRSEHIWPWNSRGQREATMRLLSTTSPHAASVAIAMLTAPVLCFLLVVLLVTWYLVYRYKRRNLYKLAAELPGLEGLSFFDVIWKFAGVRSEGWKHQICSKDVCNSLDYLLFRCLQNTRKLIRKILQTLVRTISLLHCPRSRRSRNNSEIRWLLREAWELRENRPAPRDVHSWRRPVQAPS